MSEDDFPHCPEHDKMRGVLDQSRLLGRFLDWLGEDRGISLCRWHDTIHHSDDIGDYTPEGYYEIRESFETLLADFFEIDLKKVEEEKVALIEYARAQSGD